MKVFATKVYAVFKKALPFLMAALLMISLPVAHVRVLSEVDSLRFQSKLQEIADDCGTVTDRFGNVIHNDETQAPACMANLIGVKGVAENAILERYSEALTPQGFNPFVGIDSIKDMKGCTIRTTLLSPQSQQAIADVFGSVRGSVFAYNYQTGEIYVALSLPSSYEIPDAESEEAKDGRFQNYAISSQYVPGSTMKIVTLILLLRQQDIDVASLTHTCTGAYTCLDGEEVDCWMAHGEVNLLRAVSESCNSFFANAITKLDVESAKAHLEDLGILTGDTTEIKTIDALLRRVSTTSFDSTSDHNEVWSLIGQGKSEMCAADMAMIAGAIANDGSAAEPYIIENITDPNRDGAVRDEHEAKDPVDLIPKPISKTARAIWQEAYTKSTYADTSPHTTFCKSGTAQVSGHHNRSLLGVMEEYHCAYFIYTENIPWQSPLCHRVAQCLDEQLTMTFS